MKVIANSRQIPSKEEVTRAYNYCDYLYGYLQSVSNWDDVKGHPRYIIKKDINFSHIGVLLGKTRQTIQLVLSV